MNAVQEIVKVPLWQALVDCPAFRDSWCVYDASPCKHKGRREDCELQARKLNHNPCPCPFRDWPLSCCASLRKPFMKARERKLLVKCATPEHCGELMEKKGPSAAQPGKSFYKCRNCGGVAYA